MTLPAEMADQIEKMAAEHDLEPPALTSTLLAAGLACTQIVQALLRAAQQETRSEDVHWGAGQPEAWSPTPTVPVPQEPKCTGTRTGTMGSPSARCARGAQLHAA